MDNPVIEPLPLGAISRKARPGAPRQEYASILERLEVRVKQPLR